MGWFFGVAVIVIALVVLGPLALLWGLNTLFPVLAIPYTFETWAAMLIVGALFSSHGK